MPRISLLLLVCSGLLILSLSALAQETKPPAPAPAIPTAPTADPASQTSPAMPPRRQTPQEREEEAERRAAPSQPKNPPPDVSAVPPTAAVITLTNVCPPTPKSTAARKPSCVTRITRADFDNLVAALNPGMTAQSRE